MRTLPTLVTLAALAVAAPALGQDKPRSGGELIFMLPAADPPSYDAHREDTFAVLHPAAPHYSTQDVPERARYYEKLRGGGYEVTFDPKCGYIVDPDLDLQKFQSGPTTADPAGISHANYARYKDPVLDELYVKQSRARSVEERRRYLREFERRLFDEEAHYATTLQWHRIVPHSSRVRGWTLTPSHYLNHQLDTVWLGE